MVGGISILSSPVIDYCPSICPGVKNVVSKSMGKKQSKSKKSGLLELSSSFVDSRKELLGVVNKKGSKKQRIFKGFVVSNEIGGQYEDNFEDVKTQLLNYFTLKATRTVLHQLYEMNPPLYTWLYNFITSNNKPGDGKVFIRNLAKERQELAERIMVTRLHLYGKWIKKCDHGEIYKYMSDENLELMRERLLETIVWPSDDNTEKIG